MARENGETPLMTAARLGRVDVLERLLAKGAAVNARDQKFVQTALMGATGRTEAGRPLPARGARPGSSTLPNLPPIVSVAITVRSSCSVLQTAHIHTTGR